MAPLVLLLILSILGKNVLCEADEKQDKRQAQVSSEQQYIQPGQTTIQLPEEYLSLLQQLGGQGIAQPEYQQIPIENPRAPQRFVGQPPRPPPVRLSPQAEEQRRLQEAVAQKNIREQETRDEQRAQTAQLLQYYQQQGVDPQIIRQLQNPRTPPQQVQQLHQVAQVQAQQGGQPQVHLQAQQAQIQAQQAQIQAQQSAQLQAQLYQQYQVPQYVRESQPTPQPQYVNVREAPQPAPQPQYIQQIPDRVSYSQVRFGTTKLTPQPNLVAQASARPRIQSAPEYRQVEYQPQYQQLVYQPQVGKAVIVDQKQTPEQYLIETTKPAEQRERAPVYFRPQANYNEVQASLVAQQQQAQYAQQVQEGTPSRSAIYVSTSRTPTVQPVYARQQIEEVRLPKNPNRRPLSQTELGALINAGFKVTPSPEYQYDQQYYRGIGKRQNKPIPRPVALTEQERQSLARQGISNLYRVESAESRAPPTYVLAIGGPSPTKQ